MTGEHVATLNAPPQPKCKYPGCLYKTRGERHKYCDRCRRALRLVKEGKIKEGTALIARKPGVAVRERYVQGVKRESI